MEWQSFDKIDITNNFTDSNFRAAVYEVVGKTAPERIYDTDVAGITVLNVSDRSIKSLTGLEWLTGLESLNCKSNQLLLLPDLPAGLTYLNCNSNPLSFLPALPAGLGRLNCGNDRLSSLPDLPDNLNWLGCNNNDLTSLPGLPNSLESLYCYVNQLPSLPGLPDNLVTLECGDNQLSALPGLPDNLTYLYCYDNQLSSLPDLPAGLTWLYCGSNVLTSLPTLPLSLTSLDCEQNRLIGLDLTGLDALENLYCTLNYMTEETDVTGFLGAWNDGENESSFYFWPQQTEGFKAVTNIVGVPRFATVGEPLTLTGTVIPSDATAANHDIVWEIVDDPDGTGAAIEDGVFTAASSSVVYLRARVPGGDTMDWDFINYYYLTVLPKIYTVTFDLNDSVRTGGGALVQDVFEGGAAVAPTVTRSGYTFDGWDKTFNNVTADLTVTAQWIYDGGVSPTYYTVTFNANGGSAVPAQSVAAGGKVTKPADPTKTGYSFVGWYSNVALTISYDFNNAVTASFTLYAKWEYSGGNTGGSGGNGTPTTTCTVTFNTNIGGLTIASQSVVSGGKVTKPVDPEVGDERFEGWYTDEDLTVPYNFDTPVTASFTLYAKWTGPLPFPPLASLLPYSDVTSTDWFYSAVQYVTDSGLMEGTAADKFSPNAAMTRAMLVTVLYRLEGSPEVSGDSPFPDVKAGAWYSNAILWAAQNGIADGYPNGTFGWNDNLTRQDLAVILLRYQLVTEKIAPDILMDREFSDWNEISGYAKNAVNRLTMQGLIQGKPGNRFDPMGQATRAEVATIFKRYIEALPAEGDGE